LANIKEIKRLRGGDLQVAAQANVQIDAEIGQKDPVRMELSSIFRWYSEDFKDGIVGFFKQYAEGDLRSRLQKRGGEIEVEYLDYDWSLNGK